MYVAQNWYFTSNAVQDFIGLADDIKLWQLDNNVITGQKCGCDSKGSQHS